MFFYLLVMVEELEIIVFLLEEKDGIYGKIIGLKNVLEYN